MTPDQAGRYQMPEHLRGGLTPEVLEALRDPTDDLAQQAVERERERGRTGYYTRFEVFLLVVCMIQTGLLTLLAVLLAS